MRRRRGFARKITERTGGRAYFPRSERELREAFAQIQRDPPRTEGGYYPTNKNRDGSYRRIVSRLQTRIYEFEPRLNHRQGILRRRRQRQAPEAENP